MQTKRFFHATLFLLLTLLRITPVAFAQSAPHVAVFSQTGFPFYNVSPLTSPKAIAQDLSRAGIPADLLDVTALADPNILSTRRYAALVLPSGNAYPQEAFANMRAFHAGGGILVTSGVPFTHAVARATDHSGHSVWNDLGHNSDPAQFGAGGIGVGGFTGDNRSGTTLPADDPLRLKRLGRRWTGGAQGIDVASLPAGDEVVPLLVQNGLAASALVIHHDASFSGAIDVWTNHPHSDDYDAYDTEQLLVRGTALALARAGKFSAAQVAAAYSIMNKVPKPFVYSNISLPALPRPYPTFQPKSPPPARHLSVADVQHLSLDEKLLLQSLQGIVNRKQPRIYLIFQPDDLFWLQQMQALKDTDAPVMVADPLSLIQTFHNEIHGAVVSDPKIYDSPHVAIDIAGQQNLVIATPELARRLHLPIKVDLRGKFKDDADALHYARVNLLPKSNRFLSICLNPPFDRGPLDQIIAAKGTAFWITGPKQNQEPGANETGELREVEAMLAAMPLNAVVRGFYYSGDFGYGYDEAPGVTLASRFGKVTTVSDFVANFSVLSGVRIGKLHQKRQAPPPAFDPSKVYVAIAVSDGDNLNTWPYFFRGLFMDPLHGTFPIAWGMGPSLRDVAPTIAKWFYDHATPNDEFLSDVSGIGYIYPPMFGTALKNRDAALRSFYGWTANYLSQMDMKTIRLMEVHPEDIAQAASMLPVKFLMPDYSYAGETPYSAMTYSLPSGQDVFRAVTNLPAPKMADQIRGQVGSVRPAFVNAFIQNWGLTLSDLKAMLDNLGPGYVAVTPSQLDALSRQAHASAATGVSLPHEIVSAGTAVR